MYTSNNTFAKLPFNAVSIYICTYRPILQINNQNYKFLLKNTNTHCLYNTFYIGSINIQMDSFFTDE